MLTRNYTLLAFLLRLPTASLTLNLLNPLSSYHGLFYPTRRFTQELKTDQIKEVRAVLLLTLPRLLRRVNSYG